MKIAFLVAGIDISGGMNVVFQHALYLAQKGEQIYFLSKNELNADSYHWHRIFDEYKALGIQWMTYNQIDDTEFDIAIATFWVTYFELYHVRAKRYVYFVQSIESRFVDDNEPAYKLFIEATYDLPIGVITEAKWIQDYLIKLRNLPVFLAPNGIDKIIFSPEGERIARTETGKLRVLVEGPLDVPFKNVPETIKLCGLSEADEVWLLTSSQCKSYHGVKKVFSRIPIQEVSHLYRSCDVIIKLSYVEGMFGPPLEAFHCGATCIVYDVTGYDEYIVHGYNGLVAETGDENQVIHYISQLKHNPAFLAKLKSNALETANKWIDWQISSAEFQKMLQAAAGQSTVTQEQLRVYTLRCKAFLALFEEKQFKGKVSYWSNSEADYNIPNIHWARRITSLKAYLLHYPLLYKFGVKCMSFARFIWNKFL